MRVGVIGAGRIGGNIAERWSAAGHEVVLSFSRSPEQLAEQAASIGARAVSPAEAAAFGEVVLLSVPWSALDIALEQAGSLAGRLVVDTTNQFGPGGLVTFADGRTAAQTNAARLVGARYAKAFNTLTSAFQRAAGADPGRAPAMFYATDDDDAAATTHDLVAACGLVPTRLPWSQVALLEAPRRDGAVYGEEYRPQDAARIAEAAATDPSAAARLAVELRRAD
jgi:predicted dinucleotide-binding enzyme